MLPLQWVALRGTEGAVIMWRGDSPELEYEMFCSLLPESLFPGSPILPAGEEYPPGTELWQYDLHFYDQDGERSEGFPMLGPHNLAPFDKAQAILERLHQDAVSWEEDHPEWRRAKERHTELDWFLRIFKPFGFRR